MDTESRSLEDWSEVFSASAIENFLTCERKWAWKKIHRKPDPSGPAAERGTRVHKILEGYLTDGGWHFGDDPENVERDREETEIAIAAAPHFPEPGTCEPEGEFWILIDGVKFMGKIDARQPGYILDLKTKKNLRWALTPEELEWNVQAILYAISEFARDPALEVVKLRWVYSQTSGARAAKPVDALMSRAHAYWVGTALVNIARRMRGHVRAGTRALELAPNLEACGDYGGCPYRADCNLTAGEKMRSHMKEKP